MNIKPRFPRSLYLVSGLLGGIMGVVSITVFVAIRMMPGEGDPSQLEALGFMISGILAILIPAAVLGTILGIISGRIGFSIKPSGWASIVGAALGGVVGSLLLALMLIFYTWPFLVIS